MSARTYFVTGATTGIGLAIAKTFAATPLPLTSPTAERQALFVDDTASIGKAIDMIC